MGLRADLYRVVKRTLQNAPDLDMGDVHIYRAQEQNEESEEAFPRLPAVLVQFGNTEWGSELDRKQTSDPFELSLHVLQRVDVLDESAQISRLDYLEKIGAYVQALGLDTRPEELAWASAPVRVREELDQSPEGILHDTIVLSVAFTDPSPHGLHVGPSIYADPNVKPTY